MAAYENRSGNKNDKGAFPTVRTQKERVAGFRTTLTALLKTPFVLGADWFQYYDEPSQGRSDGENYNFGLVDIYNQPYTPLTRTAADLNFQALRNQAHAPRADAAQGIPRAPPDPLGHFTATQALKHWDRERGFVNSSSEFPLADLYLSWDSKALYLGLYAQDIAEQAFYRDKRIPEIDRARWQVTIGGREKPILVRLGPGGPAVSDEPAARVVNLAGIYLTTRTIAALEVPAKLCGKEKLRSGDIVRLAATFYTHCQAERTDWEGTFQLKNHR